MSQELGRRPGPLKGRDCEVRVTSGHDVCHWGLGPHESTYSCWIAWSWSLGPVGSPSRTLIPSVATALPRIEAIASTESFSRTRTLHLLSRAEITWKDGFSVVAPIRVIVPHSTWGRKVSYRQADIKGEKKTAVMERKKRDDNAHLWSDEPSMVSICLFDRFMHLLKQISNSN